MFSELSTFQLVTVAILPTLFAIVVHEVSHGWVAKQLGDTTAYAAGRLTLNPLKHIDPIGTIVVPLVLILTTGFAFGWAKPVPINWRNLHHPKRDIALVAAAGPGANLLMAIIWAVLVKIGTLLPHDVSLRTPLLYMGLFGIMINAVLMVFNLVPIPPTDGGHILTSLLPSRIAYRVSKIEPYGMFILVGLMITGVLWKLISPLIYYVMTLIQKLVGLG
jgi:Zn-dependent protease